MLFSTLNPLSIVDTILFALTAILVCIIVKKIFQWDWLTSIIVTILSFFINLYVSVPFLVIPDAIGKIIHRSGVIYKIWPPILPAFLGIAAIYGILAGAASHFVTFKIICYFSKKSYPLVNIRLFKAFLIAYSIPAMIGLMYKSIIILNLYFQII